MDTRAYLAERLPLVERALEAALPPADAEPRRLHTAMRHAVFPGGKRLRPALALAAAEAVGGTPEAALPAATAVELVHAYSLVHDDLPCMDDDALRRGRPTVHAAWDEATAVLAGDALLTAAFEALALADGGRVSDAEAPRRLAAAADLARAAGAAGLVGGQADDLAAVGSRDVDAILSVHARKSAALIAASIVMGARLGGAAPGRLEPLRRCGEAAGVGFQIADDLLDADADGEGDDGASLVRAIGLEAARERAEALLREAEARLDPLGERAEPLRGLVRYAVRRAE